MIIKGLHDYLSNYDYRIKLTNHLNDVFKNIEIKIITNFIYGDFRQDILVKYLNDGFSNCCFISQKDDVVIYSESNIVYEIVSYLRKNKIYNIIKK